MSGWFGIQGWIDWAAQTWSTWWTWITTVLNPFYWVAQGLIYILSLLPDDFGVDLTPITTIFNQVYHWLVLADYFFPMAYFLTVVSIALLIEGATWVIRGWRIIRSLAI